MVGLLVPRTLTYSHFEFIGSSFDSTTSHARATRRRGDVNEILLSMLWLGDGSLDESASYQTPEGFKTRKTQLLNLTTSDHGLATRQPRVAPSQTHHVIAAERAWTGKVRPRSGPEWQVGPASQAATHRPGSTQSMGKVRDEGVAVMMNRAGSTPIFSRSLLPLSRVASSMSLSVLPHPKPGTISTADKRL